MNERSPRGESLSDLRLYCAFSATYTIRGVTHILQPGQAIPVWDAKNLRRVGPELKITLVTLSVDSQGELVPDAGMPALPLSRYGAALDLVDALGGDAEDDDLLMLNQARLHALGGASGVATLRPHRLPLGIGLGRGIVSSRTPVPEFEERTTTLAEAYPLMRRLHPRHAPYLPLPRLFVECEAGDNAWRGCDVMGDEPILLALTECMLPVCTRPLEHTDTYDLLAWAMSHFSRLKATRVWLGLELREEAQWSENLMRPRVTVEQMMAGEAATSRSCPRRSRGSIPCSSSRSRR